MQIINVREHVEYQDKAIQYIQNKWANENTLKLYEDCITHSLKTNNSLPIWYLLENRGEIIGCAGLISNDFISRMDLWPWVCALYIEEDYRGMSLGEKFLLRIKEDTKDAGFDKLYLCTNHIGYYEKYDFLYIGDGYHPWGSISRIYEASLTKQ
ncbi:MULTISPECIES: GNAT family N-acetyltransferase [Priestia]|uniref:GNAT family N-acetyltransferase n=1 Tax=Priestia megaterium TaxID=1404 RepID=A0AA86HXP6_PRIMG|nr:MULTISPECIES: GNAT family N-acetyltransferase [Priestia]AXI28412.1 GNAT family N-acetyltransferase [Priestia megaterium]KJL05594.1 GNAT family acetyltransferase [Priestia aryabhattai B8W22]MBX4163540.1 GNAT family N-acetyltransferase [Priestia megaterium]MED3893570.1 GNAT family N-acetyltransferase [Priestia aryabhattai]